MDKKCKEDKNEEERTFLKEWRTYPKFKDWLREDKSDKTKFRCCVCGVSRKISTTGQCALSIHAGGKRHLEVVNNRNNFFKVIEKPSSSSAAGSSEKEEDINSSNASVSSKTQLELSVAGTDTTTAHIRWVLKCVKSGFSSRSCDNLGQLMAVMFPDSKIAQNFKLGKDKFAYVVNHGLAPYFKNLLLAEIKKSNIHVFSFDESLNDATQTCEMDVYIRYWNSDEMEVKTRYLGSSFFGHGRHNDLLNNFGDIVAGLDCHKIVSSIDGWPKSKH